MQSNVACSVAGDLLQTDLPHESDPTGELAGGAVLFLVPGHEHRLEHLLAHQAVSQLGIMTDQAEELMSGLHLPG